MPDSKLARPRTFYQRWSIPILLLTLAVMPGAFFTAVMAIRSNENHVEDWLPKSFDETRKLAWFREHFASDQFVIISWEGCQLGTREGEQDDARLTNLVNLLTPADQQIRPDQAEEDELARLELAASEEDLPALSPEDRNLVNRYIKTVESGRSVLNKLTSAPLSLSQKEAMRRLKGVMIGPDGKQTCLIATLKPAALGELRKVLGNGRKRLIGDNIPPGLLPRLFEQVGIPASDIHLGGPPVDNSAIDEEGERTLIRLAGVSGLLGIGLALWSLRSVVLTMIVFMCGVVSAATSLGIVWLTGQNVDAILMSMPSLVYVLAISGAIHLVNYYRDAISTTGMYGAAERAVRLAWKPALLCSVTTAIGLLTLALSELVPIKKFGIYSASGVMTMLFVVYAVMPSALQVTGVGKRWLGIGDDSEPESNEHHGHPIWIWLSRGIIKNYALVATASLLLTGLVGAGIFRAKSSIDLLKLFDPSAKILQDYRWLEANLGKLVPLEIVLVFPDQWQNEVVGEHSPDGHAALTFVQRMEVVSKMQDLIEQRFGINGEEIVGQSLSAAAFAPRLPPEKTGIRAIVQRTAINRKLSADRKALIDTGFLRVDPDDQSELWRVSLRVAAFNDVDYGRFTTDLQAVSQPLLDACHLRARLLTALGKKRQDSSVRSRVLLWGYSKDRANKERMGDVFSLLSEQMKELNTDVEIQTTAPSQATMLEISNLSRYDAVLTFGDFAETELRLAKSSAKQLINHRLQPLDLGNRNSSQTTTGSAAFQISAVYTGVVPIVYQAQRALLDSLSESTIWSFLTITPIMMLVSRGFWSGCVAMLPNLMPIFLIFGSMGWMGVAIDIGSLMTASIALGVAVDDTIHFLARYREELDHIPDQREAIVSTYTHCAVPTLQAALISGLGLSVFAFSTFAPTQKFGWLMLSILFAGVISELVLLPALLAGPLGKFFITAKDRQKKARLSELKSGGSVVPVALYSETKHSA